ncbi:MAG: hypothetical protein F6K54_36350 [Okeania sp. SIO3B5]|nr:hypothetical protein [Okeania sp. SIO3B5]
MSKFIANLKTFSSQLIRRDFKDYLARFYRKPVLWTGSDHDLRKCTIYRYQNYWTIVKNAICRSYA